MNFLGKGKKQDLLQICEELGEDVDDKTKVPYIKRIILGSTYFNEEEVKVMLDRVIEERLQKEEDNKKEEKERQKEEREDNLARELRQHELELKKLEVSMTDLPPRTNYVSENGVSKIQLTHIMPKFEEKRDEMGLYLINFERKAEMAQVPKRDWTAYLLGVLPAEVSNMLARESPENANDYEHVKTLLLKRYKMNSEKLKQCFYRHQKTPDKNWRNYYHELRSYFTEWIEDMEVETYEQLKDLIIAEQMKFRVPPEVREHFLDCWINIKDPENLAEKLDDYESVRDSFKRKEKVPRNNFKPQESQHFKEENYFKRNAPLKEDRFDEEEREKRFERRSQPSCYECGSFSHLKAQCDKLRRCYECGSSSHLRPQCDKLKRKVETVNANLFPIENFKDVLKPYISQGKINGIEMQILRDSGASIDLICRKYVKPSMITTESVLIKTPFDESPICLPVAKVEIECDYGHVVTTAAVIRDSLNQGRYLLGNRTMKLFTEVNQNKNFGMDTINAMQTRSSSKKIVDSDLLKSESEASDSEENNYVEKDARLRAEYEATLKAKEEEERLQKLKKAEDEAKLRAEEETRFRDEEKARLRNEEFAKKRAEELAKLRKEELRLKEDEERRAKEQLEKKELAEEKLRAKLMAIEEEIKLEKERWLVEEQMPKDQEEHKWRMKAEEEKRLKEHEKKQQRALEEQQLALGKERQRKIAEEDKRLKEKEERDLLALEEQKRALGNEQLQQITEEEKHIFEEDIKLPQPSEKVLAVKSEHAQLLDVDLETVAQGESSAELNSMPATLVSDDEDDAEEEDSVSKRKETKNWRRKKKKRNALPECKWVREKYRC